MEHPPASSTALFMAAETSTTSAHLVALSTVRFRPTTNSRWPVPAAAANGPTMNGGPLQDALGGLWPHDELRSLGDLQTHGDL